jgi:hypothetical protein
MSVETILRKVGVQQGGVLLDTNVLLLHVMLSTDRNAARTWKKTEQFTERHAEFLDAILARARRLVTTPHVLTEVTNHSVGIPRSVRDQYWRHLRVFIERARERSIDARAAAREPEFSTLGLADIAQSLLSRGRPIIVTVDADLTASLERRRLPVVNLNHFVFGEG